jgi:hypothetical protein
MTNPWSQLQTNVMASPLSSTAILVMRCYPFATKTSAGSLNRALNLRTCARVSRPLWPQGPRLRCQGSRPRRQRRHDCHYPCHRKEVPHYQSKQGFLDDLEKPSAPQGVVLLLGTHLSQSQQDINAPAAASKGFAGNGLGRYGLFCTLPSVFNILTVHRSHRSSVCSLPDCGSLF